MKLAHGKTRDGKIVRISEVEKGKACNCFCPACGDNLIAKKGNIKVHHFAHCGIHGECAEAGETAIHLMAKDIIAQQKRITLPSYFVDSYKCLHSHHTEIERYEIEATVKWGNLTIRPDLIAYPTVGDPFAIEIAVTHFIDEEKKEKFRLLGLSVIEVNLSHINREIKQEQLDSILTRACNQGGIYWKYHLSEGLQFDRSRYKKYIDARGKLAGWLQDIEKGNDGCGISPLYWRSNWGVHEGLKYHTTDEAWYFETCSGLWSAQDVFHKRIDSHQQDVGMAEPKCNTECSTCIYNTDRGGVLFESDISIFHKGSVSYIIEITNKDFPLNKDKVRKMLNFIDIEDTAEIYEIDADFILQQDTVPDSLQCKKISHAELNELEQDSLAYNETIWYGWMKRRCERALYKKLEFMFRYKGNAILNKSYIEYEQNCHVQCNEYEMYIYIYCYDFFILIYRNCSIMDGKLFLKNGQFTECSVNKPTSDKIPIVYFEDVDIPHYDINYTVDINVAEVIKGIYNSLREQFA